MKVYTAKEIQDLLHLGKNATYSLMRSDGFPSYRINNQYFITDDNLQQWFKTVKGKTFTLR